MNILFFSCPRCKASITAREGAYDVEWLDSYVDDDVRLRADELLAHVTQESWADLHLERRAVMDDWGTYEIQGSYDGFRLGIDFNSSREYYDSVSPADGGRAPVRSPRR